MSDETLVGLAEDIRAGRISPVEVVERSLGRIRKWDSRLHAFIRLDEEGALKAARALQADAAAGRWRGPLHGVPLAFKDLCHLRVPHEVGSPTTSCPTRS